jgi:hypothetical protein
MDAILDSFPELFRTAETGGARISKKFCAGFAWIEGGLQTMLDDRICGNMLFFAYLASSRLKKIVSKLRIGLASS